MRPAPSPERCTPDTVAPGLAARASRTLASPGAGPHTHRRWLTARTGSASANATCSGSRGFLPFEVANLLDLADGFVALNRQTSKKLDLLKGRTLINLFFENSTRTQTSFELAGKRLGADVVNMAVAHLVDHARARP